MEQPPEKIKIKRLEGLVPVVDMGLQSNILKVVLQMMDHDYDSDLAAMDDISDDIRHVMLENGDRVLAAFQGQEVFSSLGHEDLIFELAEKAFARAPFTRGQH